MKDLNMDTFLDFEKLKSVLEQYMIKNGYRHTDSPKYRIKHNEMTRMAKVAITTYKREGLKRLFIAIKGKIRRKFLVKSP